MDAEVETKVIDHDSKAGAKRPARASGEPTSPPRRVGRYELVHRLGHGGMATVYLGRAIGTAGFEKLVAVKVIHPHLASEPEFVEMFLDEARIASRLHHPHVVEILDLGRDDDDVFFMVMEYIEGETLASLLRQQRKTAETLPLAAVLQVMADACEGLAAAHELADPDGRPYELVHRDVSPHNLLVGMDGRVKVVDFGIMKAAGKRSSTLTGQLRGKLAYMSPEQAAAEPLDHRTDIFALGAVLWEMCCGERLFAAQTEAETLAKVSRCEVPDVLARRPEFPVALRDILDRALAVDREQRYESARDMLKDVRALMRSLDEDDPRASLAEAMQHAFSSRIEYIRATARASGDSTLAQRSARESADTNPPSASSISTLGGPKLPAGATGTLTRSLTGTSARQWSLWLLLPLLGAAIGTFVVSMNMRGSTSDDAPTPPAPVESITPTATIDRPSPHPDAERDRPEPAPEPAAAVQWSFETRPEGARIIVDGEPWPGTTPLSVELPHKQETVAVRIEKEGFVPIEIRLMPTRSDAFEYELEPLRKVANPSFKLTTKPRTKPDKRPASDAQPEPGPKPDGDGRTLPDMPDFRGSKKTASGD
jgi:eukaryotic-like serine/threonine-protein kinase